MSKAFHKKVGSRRVASSPLSSSVSSKMNAVAWRKAFPTPFVPKGVYRFNSHEDADAWLWKVITRPPKS